MTRKEWVAPELVLLQVNSGVDPAIPFEGTVYFS